MLEMKPVCEKCEVPTPKDGAAEICSFECTFCPSCAEAMAHTCPNCGRSVRDWIRYLDGAYDPWAYGHWTGKEWVECVKETP